MKGSPLCTGAFWLARPRVRRSFPSLVQTFRVWFWLSAVYTFPSGPMVMPWGAPEVVSHAAPGVQKGPVLVEDDDHRVRAAGKQVNIVVIVHGHVGAVDERGPAGALEERLHHLVPKVTFAECRHSSAPFHCGFPAVSWLDGHWPVGHTISSEPTMGSPTRDALPCSRCIHFGSASAQPLCRG